MRIARRVKNIFVFAAIAVSVSVAAGTGATIAGADPAAEPAPPAKTKEDGLVSEDGARMDACCYQQVWSADVVVPPGGFASAVAVCPTNHGYNQYVFGGGAWNSATGAVVMTDSFPRDNRSWLIYMKNNGASEYIIRAWAVCGLFYPAPV